MQNRLFCCFSLSASDAPSNELPRGKIISFLSNCMYLGEDVFSGYSTIRRNLEYPSNRKMIPQKAKYQNILWETNRKVQENNIAKLAPWHTRKPRISNSYIIHGMLVPVRTTVDLSMRRNE